MPLNMLYAMLLLLYAMLYACYESGKESCANQASFLGPAVGACICRCCVAVAGQWCSRQQSGLQPRCSEPEHSVVAALAGRATAIAADLRSPYNLH